METVPSSARSMPNSARASEDRPLPASPARPNRPRLVMDSETPRIARLAPKVAHLQGDRRPGAASARRALRWAASRNMACTRLSWVHWLAAQLPNSPLRSTLTVFVIATRCSGSGSRRPPWCPRPEFRDHLVQVSRGSDVRQGRRRLVHHDDLRRGGDRRRISTFRLVGHAQPADRRVARQAERPAGDELGVTLLIRLRATIPRRCGSMPKKMFSITVRWSGLASSCAIIASRSGARRKAPSSGRRGRQRGPGPRRRQLRRRRSSPRLICPLAPTSAWTRTRLDVDGHIVVDGRSPQTLHDADEPGCPVPRSRHQWGVRSAWPELFTRRSSSA